MPICIRKSTAGIAINLELAKASQCIREGPLSLKWPTTTGCGGLAYQISDLGRESHEIPKAKMLPFLPLFLVVFAGAIVWFGFATAVVWFVTAVVWFVAACGLLSAHHDEWCIGRWQEVFLILR